VSASATASVRITRLYRVGLDTRMHIPHYWLQMQFIHLFSFSPSLYSTFRLVYLTLSPSLPGCTVDSLRTPTGRSFPVFPPCPYNLLHLSYSWLCRTAAAAADNDDDDDDDECLLAMSLVACHQTNANRQFSSGYRHDRCTDVTS